MGIPPISAIATGFSIINHPFWGTCCKKPPYCLLTPPWSQGSSVGHPLRLGHVENLRVLLGDQMVDDTHVKPRCIAGTTGQIALFHKARGFESQDILDIS